jgi:Sec-independent protein translocase protein TatA
MPVDLIVVLLAILAVVLLWRGPKTLPKWGEALGHAVRGARDEASKAQAGIQRRLDDDGPGDDPRPPA